MIQVLSLLGVQRKWFEARLNLKSERGATAVEYGIMVALIAAVIIAAVVFLGQQTSSTFSCTASAISTKDGTSCERGAQARTPVLRYVRRTHSFGLRWVVHQVLAWSCGVVFNWISREPMVASRFPTSERILIWGESGDHELEGERKRTRSIRGRVRDHRFLVVHDLVWNHPIRDRVQPLPSPASRRSRAREACV